MVPKFTFKTDLELALAERRGYIDSYDIVRMVVSSNTPDGQKRTTDFPCKTEEEFIKYVLIHQNNIQYIYQATHYYDVFDYCDHLANCN